MCTFPQTMYVVNNFNSVWIIRITYLHYFKCGLVCMVLENLYLKLSRMKVVYFSFNCQQNVLISTILFNYFTFIDAISFPSNTLIIKVDSKLQNFIIF